MSRVQLIRFILLISCVFAFVPIFDIGRGSAAEEEVLTPRPGAKIMARNPETHLVLRRPLNGGPVKVKVEKTGEILNPVVEMEGEEHIYLHYRLPMVSGQNSYSLIPGGRRLELNFQKIQADITLKSLAKDAYFFHRDESLPESCRDCHDLQETEIIEPVGLKKQISCGICHQNLIDKGMFKHGPTLNQECLGCHLQSEEPFRIGFPKVGTRKLCLTCHAGKRAWYSKKFVHGPMYLGGCTLCHDPHGEKYRYQLWAEGSKELCVICHTDKENDKENPLPFVHGIIKGKGCVVCHDPHATNQQFMLYEPINKLCLGCHPTVLANNSLGHPVARHPVAGHRDYARRGRELVCSSCHEPHGSFHQDLLIETKLGGRLCRVCHVR